MAGKYQINEADLVDNPTARVPICLVLDVSASMSGNPSLGSPTLQVDPTPIEALNDGLMRFYASLLRSS